MSKSLSQQGTILGDRYLLHEIIGQGGMADVFRATDQVRENDVAVKLLRQPDPAEAERDRFIAEAKTLSSLSHPGLVTVLDVNSDHDRLYLVMELVDGKPLSELIQSGPVDPYLLAGMGSQLVDAIGYVHAHGIVHRDIKPANILIAADDRISLADFGIARILGDLRHHTATGFTMGTAAYVSPEQVQGHQVTPATDVYSLGLVLLEALTGEQTFKGTPAEMSLARLAVQPHVPESVDPAWRDVLQHMTAIEPSARPAVAWVQSQLTAITSISDGDGTTLITPLPTLPLAVTAPLTEPQCVDTRPLPTETQSETKALSSTVVEDQAPNTATDTTRAWWQAWPTRGLAAVAVVVLLVALGYIAFGSGGNETNVPDVPGKIGDDLQRLHEAVES